MPKIVDRLGLSFSSTKELNDIIDNSLPGRPPFECHDFIIGGETLELHFRDVLSCIRSIYGDPSFARDLAVAPERHYADRERTVRVYSEMHTGDWWWAVQVREGILARDCSNYLTIGADDSRSTSTRCYCSPRYYIFRQDAIDAFPWEERVSSLSHHRKHPKGYSPKAIAPCSNPCRLHPNHQARRNCKQGRSPPRDRESIPCMYANNISPDHSLW